MPRETPVYLRDVYSNLDIGEGTYGDLKIFDWKDGTQIKIGKYSCFGLGCKVLLGGDHRSDWLTTYPFPALAEWPTAREIQGHPQSRGNIVIGHDVWCGAETMILAGSKISTGAVIGARSTVLHTCDIPPYSIAVGHPAKVIGHRFTHPDQRRRMLEIAWWDWPQVRIAAATPLLCQPDIEKFFAAYYRGQV